MSNRRHAYDDPHWEKDPEPSHTYWDHRFREHYLTDEDLGEPCPMCGAIRPEPHGDCDYPLWIRETYGIG